MLWSCPRSPCPTRATPARVATTSSIATSWSFADYADAFAAPAFAGDPLGELVACRCECGSFGCSERITLTFDEYETVRSQAGSLAVAPAHRFGFRSLTAHARFHHVEPADAQY